MTATPASAGALDLDPEHLAALRASYSRARLHELVLNALTSPHPACAGWMEFIVRDLYDARAMPARERELIVLALLTAQGELGPLAIHVYWALMEGVTPPALAHALTLAGVYAGVSRYVAARAQLQRVLGLLDRQARAGATSVEAVLESLLAETRLSAPEHPPCDSPPR